VGAGADARGLTGAIPPTPVYHAAVTSLAPPARSAPERVAALATGLAAAYVIVAVAILPFLSPAWVSFEQGRTHAAELAGYSPAELSIATNAILHDLVLGPPDFAIEVNGTPVLEERERAHMRDVRGVFTGFYALALIAVIALATLVWGARRAGHPERAWRAIGAGMGWLVAAIVVAGVIVTFFFDAAFEVFHRLFFPSGSYTFDPRTDRLVQLFPFDFWSETTLAAGVVILTLAVLVWLGTRGLASAATGQGHEPAAAVPSSPVVPTTSGQPR
jgi:integral membrane protein (TIGR01906 family)